MLRPDDPKVVAGYLGNNANALVAMLATTSLGSAWTAVSTEIGPHAVLERLKQISPAVLFVDNASYYNGKAYSNLQKVKEIVADLPSVRAVVVFDTVPADDSSDFGLPGIAISYEKFVEARELVAARYAFVAKDQESFNRIVERLMIDDDESETFHTAIAAFVSAKTGATNIILQTIENKGWLTA